MKTSEFQRTHMSFIISYILITGVLLFATLNTTSMLFELEVKTEKDYLATITIIVIMLAVSVPLMILFSVDFISRQIRKQHLDKDFYQK